MRDYYKGWEKKDWEQIRGHLTDDFTFTSPHDDHLNLDDYKKICFDQGADFHEYNFQNFMEKGDEAFARWECIINGRLVKNTEYFLFEGDKIKAVVVYFGDKT